MPGSPAMNIYANCNISNAVVLREILNRVKVLMICILTLKGDIFCAVPSMNNIICFSKDQSDNSTNVNNLQRLLSHAVDEIDQG